MQKCQENVRVNNNQFETGHYSTQNFRTEGEFENQCIRPAPDTRSPLCIALQEQLAFASIPRVAGVSLPHQFVLRQLSFLESSCVGLEITLPFAFPVLILSKEVSKLFS